MEKFSIFVSTAELVGMFCMEKGYETKNAVSGSFCLMVRFALCARHTWRGRDESSSRDGLWAGLLDRVQLVQ
jgi:hypothetical protein